MAQRKIKPGMTVCHDGKRCTDTVTVTGDAEKALDAAGVLEPVTKQAPSNKAKQPPAGDAE